MALRTKSFIGKALAGTDKLQQRYHALGFMYAVVRKYSDDVAGQQAALLTYYGFLSLFPLLLVATSIADFIAQHNLRLRAKLLADTTSYFPVVGQQLQQSVHGSHRTGIALIIGLLFALYGARGIANAVRGALDNAWATPRTKRSDFLVGMLKSLGLLTGAGLGLLVTTALASYATAALGHSFIFRLIPIAMNTVLLYLIFMYVFLIGPSRRRPHRDLRIGAITVVVGLLILQTAGGYLITHELHRVNGLYGQFGLVLAVLSWMYLLAQLFMYAVEINVVHTYRLWPRGMNTQWPTAADEKAQQLHVNER
jgi:membrane protein